MRTISPVKLLIGGFSTPEGPAFDREGNLWHVNWESSSIIKMTPSGHSEEAFNTGGIPAGLAFHPDGSLYIADEGDAIHGVMRLTMDGHAEIVVNEYEGRALNGANDLVFDRSGNLYFSDPWGSNAENPIGGFYRLRVDSTLERLDTGLAFPNGVALAADESAVYLAETYRNRILSYAIAPDGSVGAREIWATTKLPPGADGMAFDEHGDLYVAHYNGGCIDVFGQNGGLVDQIEVPGQCPTNVAFGGPGNRTLVITEVETQSLYWVEMAMAGQPLNDGRSRH